MNESAPARLRRLLEEYRRGTLEVGAFCSEFEHTYNMELNKRTLSPVESEAFGALFEEVVWYSPFAEERAKIQNYRGDEDIARAAEIAASCLSGET